MGEKKQCPDGVAAELWENAMRNEYRDSVERFVSQQSEKYKKQREKAIYRSERKKRKAFYYMQISYNVYKNTSKRSQTKIPLAISLYYTFWQIFTPNQFG